MSSEDSLQPETLNSSELRKELLKFGYDLPTSIDKDFLVKKLKSAIERTAKEKKGPVRKTPEPRGTRASAASAKVPTPTRQNARLNRTLVSDQAKAPTLVNSRSFSVPRGEEEQSTSRLVARSRSTGRITRRAASSPYKPQANSTARRDSPRDAEDSGESDGDETEEINDDDLSPPARKTIRLQLPRRLGGNDSFFNSAATTSATITQPSSLAPSVVEQSFRKFSPSPPTIQRQTPSRRPKAAVKLPLAATYGITSSRTETSFRTETVSSPTFENYLGLIVNGRHVQTNPTPNDPNEPSKFLFNIPSADEVEYLVVYLTGSGTFPSGCGGQVFFGWPNERNEIDQWQLLGHISNIRPSAIFSIKDLKQPADITDISFGFGLPSNNSKRRLSGPTTAQIGVSIEPLDIIVSSGKPNLQL